MGERERAAVEAAEQAERDYKRDCAARGGVPRPRERLELTIAAYNAALQNESPLAKPAEQGKDEAQTLQSPEHIPDRDEGNTLFDRRPPERVVPQDERDTSHFDVDDLVEAVGEPDCQGSIIAVPNDESDLYEVLWNGDGGEKGNEKAHAAHELRLVERAPVPQDDYKAVKQAIFEELLRQAAARGERPQGDERTYRLIHSDRAGALALAVLAVHSPVPQDDCQHSLSITRDGGIGKRIVYCVKCRTVIGDVSDGYNAVLDSAEQAPAPVPQDDLGRQLAAFPALKSLESAEKVIERFAVIEDREAGEWLRRHLNNVRAFLASVPQDDEAMKALRFLAYPNPPDYINRSEMIAFARAKYEALAIAHSLSREEAGAARVPQEEGAVMGIKESNDAIAISIPDRGERLIEATIGPCTVEEAENAAEIVQEALDEQAPSLGAVLCCDLAPDFSRPPVPQDERERATITVETIKVREVFGGDVVWLGGEWETVKAGGTKEGRTELYNREGLLIFDGVQDDFVLRRAILSTHPTAPEEDADLVGEIASPKALLHDARVRLDDRQERLDEYEARLSATAPERERSEENEEHLAEALRKATTLIRSMLRGFKADANKRTMEAQLDELDAALSSSSEPSDELPPEREALKRIVALEDAEPPGFTASPDYYHGIDAAVTIAREALSSPSEPSA